MRESSISQKIMVAISKLPNSLIFRRNVGDFETKDGRYISIGKTGEADLQGFIGGQLCPRCEYPIHPKPIAVEVKSDSKYTKQSEKQEDWQKNVWERRGALYVLAKSIDDVIDKIKGDLNMPAENEYRKKIVTRYIMEVVDKPNDNITSVLECAAEKIGVSLSTIHRWRRFGEVTTAEHALAVILAVNKEREKKKLIERCGIKDIAILCNYKGLYSLEKNENK